MSRVGIDMTGRRYGRLLVLERQGKRGPHPMWRCQCDCGNEAWVQGSDMRTGKSLSCGCLRKVAAHVRHTKHGLKRHPLYTTWQSMRNRCKYKSVKLWYRYGGRGIAVCDQWNDAEEFIRWAEQNGWRSGLQLDRINNDGNYEPTNCRFVTPSENCRNRG